MTTSKSTTRRHFIKTAVAGAAGATTALVALRQPGPDRSAFHSALPSGTERVFIGPEFWANRLQDWRLARGRIECRSAELQVLSGRAWKTVQTADINPSGWVAHFRVDNWDDSRSVPYTISNTYTRYWNPGYPPLAGPPGAQPFSGNYEDGFHNKLTVHAVANPVENPAPGQFPEPMELHRKATGYNIIRFDKAARTITLETRPRYAGPHGGAQYPGWPFTIAQADNYGRKAVAYLPPLRFTRQHNPVVQVVEEATGEVVYALRVQGQTFRPRVFAPGRYTLHVGEPRRTLTGIQAADAGSAATITID